MYNFIIKAGGGKDAESMKWYIKSNDSTGYCGYSDADYLFLTTKERIIPKPEQSQV